MHPLFSDRMIRVKIRRHGQTTSKVIRFDESIEFVALLRKIVDKLGASHELDGVAGSDLTQLFQLRLGTDCVLEDTTEIDNGDEVFLVKIVTNTYRNDVKSTSEVKKEQCDARIKNECNENESKGNLKPAGVAGRDKYSLAVKNESKDDIEVISISSDESGDHDETDDESFQEAYESSSQEEENENEKDEKTRTSIDDNKIETKGRQKRVQKPPPTPPLEVIMDKKDIPSAPGKFNYDQEKCPPHCDGDEKVLGESSLLVDGTGKRKADQVVKERIIKLLNTGFHDQSNEHEAKNAMKLAQRLMRKHNLSQALLLKEREAKNDEQVQDGEILKGGMVRVQIVNRKTRKPSLFVRWISQLTHPVCENFGVKAYHQTRRGIRCDVVFYGIYSNAQLAGYAFKVATERISQMSAVYKPETPFWKEISTKSSRLSYALGIVQGMSKDVRTNLRMEKARREQQLARARLAQSKGEVYAESEDEEQNWDDCEGTGISIMKNDGSIDSPTSGPLQCNMNSLSSESTMDRSRNCITKTILQDRIVELEKEEQAALVLIDHNRKIAEEVLKERDIKLRIGRKRKAIQFDRRSYDQGVVDSKEIDVNQRAIRDEVQVKTEKT